MPSVAARPGTSAAAFGRSVELDPGAAGCVVLADCVAKLGRRDAAIEWLHHASSSIRTAGRARSTSAA